MYRKFREVWKFDLWDLNGQTCRHNTEALIAVRSTPHGSKVKRGRIGGEKNQYKLGPLSALSQEQILCNTVQNFMKLNDSVDSKSM